MADAPIFPAEHRQTDRLANYTPQASIKMGDRFKILDLNITVTSPAGVRVPVSKTPGTGFVIASSIPFHIGIVEGTVGLCKVVIKPNFEFSEDSSAILLDLSTSPSTVEHYILLGYDNLEDVAESLLDVLGLDTKLNRVKKYHTTVANVASWIIHYKENHDKPFAAMLCSDDTTHYGVGIPKGKVPLSYSFINGHKVYKACILGVIEPMNDTWRTLCDTITFMDEGEILILYISSNGGDTQTASSLIAAMTQCRGTVVTLACGPCASAGPVIWAKGDIRLMTDNASMMVHSMAISDPVTKTTGQISDLGDFSSSVAREFLKKTVGAVGLSTDEEIEIIIDTSREYYHNPATVHERTKTPVIGSDKDIWSLIEGRVS